MSKKKSHWYAIEYRGVRERGRTKKMYTVIKATNSTDAMKKAAAEYSQTAGEGIYAFSCDYRKKFDSKDEAEQCVECWKAENKKKTGNNAGLSGKFIEAITS